MADVVLYRKYRPQTFSDVRGQDHIVSVLEGSLAQKNVAHAYLFAGGRGTGKTSLARIFSRALGVSEKDMYEIDAASNRGIDDIRELRDGVHLLPFDSPYKVYIIDEVHMLTKDAFNAFLKTLEEPPPHVIFILATTELEKLPETIVSRCQSFTFKKPNPALLRDVIVDVAEKEKYKLEGTAVDLIALLADGSFRDALGILQKVLFASKPGAISLEQVETLTGAPSAALVGGLLKGLEAKDSQVSIKAIEQAAEQGVDMKLFSTLLLHRVRAVLLLRFASDMKSQLKERFVDTEFTELEKIASDKQSPINSKTLTRLLDAHLQLGFTAVAQLPLELAVFDLCAGSEEK